MVMKGTKRQGNYPVAKYVYKADGKHPYEYKECPTCNNIELIRKEKIYCSYKCSKMGELNPRWAGDNATYSALHGRVYRRRGNAYDYPCSLCPQEAKEWAHIHDTAMDDEYNFMPLCKSCHGKYDIPAKKN